jgi:hypothetical protein
MSQSGGGKADGSFGMVRLSVRLGGRDENPILTKSRTDPIHAPP